MTNIQGFFSSHLNSICTPTALIGHEMSCLRLAVINYVCALSSALVKQYLHTYCNYDCDQLRMCIK